MAKIWYDPTSELTGEAAKSQPCWRQQQVSLYDAARADWFHPPALEIPFYLTGTVFHVRIQKLNALL